MPLAWGAVNEWTTQAAYARLGELAHNSTLTELLRRIMRQEGRHIDFYSHEAATRLGQHRLARRTTRFMLQRVWAPVGSGVMPASREVNFLTRHLLHRRGRDATHSARIDRQIDRLPRARRLESRYPSHAVAVSADVIAIAHCAPRKETPPSASTV